MIATSEIDCLEFTWGNHGRKVTQQQVVLFHVEFSSFGVPWIGSALIAPLLLPERSAAYADGKLIISLYQPSLLRGVLLHEDAQLC